MYHLASYFSVRAQFSEQLGILCIIIRNPWKKNIKNIQYTLVYNGCDELYIKCNN